MILWCWVVPLLFKTGITVPMIPWNKSNFDWSDYMMVSHLVSVHFKEAQKSQPSNIDLRLSLRFIQIPGIFWRYYDKKDIMIKSKNNFLSFTLRKNIQKLLNCLLTRSLTETGMGLVQENEKGRKWNLLIYPHRILSLIENMGTSLQLGSKTTPHTINELFRPNMAMCNDVHLCHCRLVFPAKAGFLFISLLRQ